MSKNNLSIKSDWWEDFFNKNYLKTYSDILTPEITAKQVDFVIKELGVNKNHSLLDLGCGYGRHSLELAKRGYKVTGLDYSNYMINLARKRAKKEDLKVKFIRGDMRKINFESCFDYVLSFFTSFGYFDKESDDIKVIKGAYKALKKNGYFFLDLANSQRKIKEIKKGKRLKNGLWTSIRIDRLSNDLIVKTEDFYDSSNKRWISKRYWKEKDKKNFYISSVRLFTLKEIKSLLRLGRLNFVKSLGSYSGSIYSVNSPRMIILAKKGSPLRTPLTKEPSS